MRRLWKPGWFERGGNTKTHGIVRGEFIVHDDLPEHLRRGIFAEPQTYRAWVRFSGPGPYITPDIDDVGFMSMSIKLMGVPGPKLLDDEQHTQDLFGVSTPTFVTPDTRANAQPAALEPEERADLLLPRTSRDPHVLDSIMQVLWTKTQTSPLEGALLQLRAVPARRGPGDAVLVLGRAGRSGRRVPRLPRRPPDNYLRDAMVEDARRGGRRVRHPLQLQTDPHLMPIENNARALADEALAARAGGDAAHPEADVRLAGSSSTSRGCSPTTRGTRIAEHRPLGNQSRARKRMYYELVAAAAEDERGRALRADGRRGVSRLAGDPGQVAHVPRGRAGRSTRRPAP